jgi:hypothetical protein
VSAAPRRFRVGDVFRIPLGEDRVGYGQIAHEWGRSGGHFYFVIFEHVDNRDNEVDLKELVGKDIALLALSMDALLQHGHWESIGNAEVDTARIPWPAYKEGKSPPGAYDVVDYTGSRRREASPEEVARLPFRPVIAPIRLEKALRALHGLEDWDAAYEELRPVADDETSARLFPIG